MWESGAKETGRRLYLNGHDTAVNSWCAAVYKRRMKWLLSTTTNTTALPYSISNFQMGRVSRSADAATSKHALSAITSPSPPPSLWKIKKREAERKNDNEKTQTLNESRTSPASQPTERNTIYRRLDILTFFFSFFPFLFRPPSSSRNIGFATDDYYVSFLVCTSSFLIYHPVGFAVEEEEEREEKKKNLYHCVRFCNKMIAARRQAERKAKWDSSMRFCGVFFIGTSWHPHICTVRIWYDSRLHYNALTAAGGTKLAYY